MVCTRMEIPFNTSAFCTRMEIPEDLRICFFFVRSRYSGAPCFAKISSHSHHQQAKHHCITRTEDLRICLFFVRSQYIVVLPVLLKSVHTVIISKLSITVPVP
jgi:hypothetical protein